MVTSLHELNHGTTAATGAIGGPRRRRENQVALAVPDQISIRGSGAATDHSSAQQPRLTNRSLHLVGPAPAGAIAPPRRLLRWRARRPTLPTLHRPLALLFVACAASACAPTLVSGTMANPARTTEKLQSSQEYDIGPYKENHRFKMTLKDWTPTTLGVDIKVVDFGDCGLARSYSFTLVDDSGGKHPFRAAADPVTTNELGRAQVPLNVSTVSGTFDVAIGRDAHAVTIQQRPQPSLNCPALDFKWTFQ
jgi:hypothetical protein